MKKQLFLFFLLCLLLSSCRTYYIGTNPASMLKNNQQADGLALTACPDTALNGLLYYLDFKNDYQLDKMLKADVRGLGDFKTYVGTKILSTGKVLANLKKLKTGCTAFVCQSPSGDVLYARNFDFTADGPAPVVMTNTSPNDGYKSVSLISMSLLKYPKGSLSGGTEQYDRHKHDIMTTTAMRIGHGHDRFETAKDHLQKKLWILNEEEAMSVLQNVSQEPTVRKTSNTQWSVVYNLTKGTYMLCISRDYYNVVRGSINKRCDEVATFILQ